MALNLYGSSSGLFDILGKVFFAAGTLNTARGTTVPTEIRDIWNQARNFSNPSADVQSAIEGLPAAADGIETSLEGAMQSLVQMAEDYIIARVADQITLESRSFEAALDALVLEMAAQTHYVDPNVVGLSSAAVGSPTGDVTILYGSRLGNGRPREFMLAETITLTVTDDGEFPVFDVRSNESATGPLASDWPLASGISTSLTAVDPSSTLVTNGDFADETIANVPDGWSIQVGTVGTTISVTDPEIQTVTITGTPASGHYLLQWQDRLGTTRTTEPIEWDATDGNVQTALRAIPGLENVTVSATGTSPNFVHTVTFTGVGGNINQLTSVNKLNTGSIAHATTQAGTDLAFRTDKAIKITGDGSQLTAVYTPLTLSPRTHYFAHLRIRADSGLVAGVMEFEVVDGVSGSVLQDAEGNNAALQIDLTAVSTSTHVSKWFQFSIDYPPRQPVYLRLRLSTAITNTKSVGISDVMVFEGSELYVGGPVVAAVAGKTPAVVDDAWTVTATNNRAGAFHEWFNRFFDLASRGVELPVSGVTNIPDSLIA